MVPLLLGVALLVVSAVGWVSDPAQFYFSYLVGWTFCLSLALGSLFFVTIKHVTKAYWVVTVRRIPEVLIWSFPLLIVLFIPVLFGMHDLYHWTHEGIADPASPDYDEVIAGKVAYLNTPFFLIRMVFYFAVWTYISYRLYTLCRLRPAHVARRALVLDHLRRVLFRRGVSERILLHGPGGHFAPA